MSIIEVLLRLGCGLVAWMVVYTHFIWLGVLRTAGCGVDGDEMHRLLLGMVPFTLLFSFLLRSTRPLPDIHGILRWLAIPLLPLAASAVLTIWSVFSTVNLSGGGVCAAISPSSWHVWWAPVQAITVGFCIWSLLRVWRMFILDKRSA